MISQCVSCCENEPRSPRLYDPPKLSRSLADDLCIICRCRRDRAAHMANAATRAHRAPSTIAIPAAVLILTATTSAAFLNCVPLLNTAHRFPCSSTRTFWRGLELDAAGADGRTRGRERKRSAPLPGD